MDIYGQLTSNHVDAGYENNEVNFMRMKSAGINANHTSGWPAFRELIIPRGFHNISSKGKQDYEFLNLTRLCYPAVTPPDAHVHV